MIRSMTGFGAAEYLDDRVRVAVEVKAVNNRFVKLNLRTPEGLGAIEVDIDRLVRQHITRGTVNLTLAVSPRGAAARAPINTDVLMAYRDDLAAAGQRMGAAADLGALLALPGVVGDEKVVLTGITGLADRIRQVVAEALERLDAMRSAEGAATAADMEASLADIARRLKTIAARGPQVVAEYRDRLRERVQALLDGTELPVDDASLAREVAFYAERSDINEEAARLASHAEQFRALLGESGPGGRKLEFLAQEMHREVNTLGSKSNDADLAREVVEIKVDVDRLREQSQNVE